MANKELIKEMDKMFIEKVPMALFLYAKLIVQDEGVCKRSGKKRLKRYLTNMQAYLQNYDYSEFERYVILAAIVRIKEFLNLS